MAQSLLGLSFWIGAIGFWFGGIGYWCTLAIVTSRGITALDARFARVTSVAFQLLHSARGAREWLAIALADFVGAASKLVVNIRSKFMSQRREVGHGAIR